VPDVRNLLLQQLPQDVLNAILPHMDVIDLQQGDVLFEAGQRFQHVHFFEGGMSSEIAVNPDGKSVEVGCVGFEGFSGVPAALGVDSSEHRAFMQAPTRAFRMRTEVFQKAMDSYRPLASLMLRYVHIFLMQTAATALNNGRYPVDRRLARWLLMSQDRLGDELPLTHDFLGLMLGVRRPSVTDALHQLEGERLIKAERGLITVRNRDNLLATPGTPTANRSGNTGGLSVPPGLRFETLDRQ